MGQLDVMSQPARHWPDVFFADSRVARPDCMWEGAAARRPPVFSGLSREGSSLFVQE